MASETIKIRRTRSIGFRMSLFVTLAVLIFGALAIYFVATRQERLYQNEKRRQWELLVKSMTPNLMNALASNNLESIHGILNRFAAGNVEINTIFLTNEKGNIVYATNVKRDGTKLTPRETKAFSISYAKDPSTGVPIVNFSRNIKTETNKLGALYIGFEYLPPLEKERMTSVLMLESSIRDAVKQCFMEMDFFQANFITQEMMKGLKDIVYFKVVGSDGTIISAPNKKEILQPNKDKYLKGILSKINVRKPVWTRKLRHGGKPVLEVTLGMFDGDTPLGIVVAGYDLSSLNKALARDRMLLGILTFCSILLVVAVAMAIASRISRPVVHLMNVSREVGAGNLDAQAQVRSGGDEMRQLGMAFNLMIKGLKERNMIKDTFSRYVSKQVADELLNDPEKVALGGESKEVTILFSDIRGFTTISERLPAYLVVEILNEYFNEMVDAVFEFEGTLDKYIGDAIMAVFGSPIAHTDDPIRAIKTALRMKERLVALNKKWMDKDGLQHVHIGIGINTGKVIAGNIGHLQRMEYTVIGDNVNLASRIEGLTKSYNAHIIIAESTYEKVSDLVEVKQLGEVTVKGKSKPVVIYELLRLKES